MIGVIDNIKLYTVPEVAKILGVNKGSVYSLIHKGVLTAIKFGRYKVPEFAIANFLQAYNGYDLTDLDNIQLIS